MALPFSVAVSGNGVYGAQRLLFKQSQKQNKDLTPRLPGECQREHLTQSWMKCSV
jgi:hypothetical protein